MATQKTRLTTAFMRTLRPGRAQAYQDTEMRNLLVKVGKDSVSFYLQFKFEQRQWKLSLGKFPAMTVDEARRKAIERIAAITTHSIDEDGRDANPVLRDVVEGYVETRRSDADRRTARSILKIFSSLYNRKINTVTKSDIEKLHSRNSGRPVAANNAVRALRAAINQLSASLGRKMDNPCVGIRMYRQMPRERFLTREEAPRFIDAVRSLQTSGLHYVQADVILMLLYTGARKSNVCQMMIEEIDESNVWTIPAEKFKGHAREHRIQLGDLEMEIVERHRGARTSGFLFEYRGKPLSDIRKTIVRACEIAGIDDFHPHDLRRTLGTWMLSSGAPLEIVSKKLGHSDTRITQQVYAHVLPDVSRKATDAAIGAMLAGVSGR